MKLEKFNCILTYFPVTQTISVYFLIVQSKDLSVYYFVGAECTLWLLEENTW